MTRIGVDIEANVSNLDQGLGQAEKRIENFGNTAEKASNELSSAANRAGETLAQVGKEVVTGDFSRIPETLGRAALASPALASSVLGLVAPYAAVAAAIGIAGKMAYDMDVEFQTFQKTLIMTGNAAGTSADQMTDAARRIADSSDFTQGAASDVLNQMAATGKVSAEVMEGAAKAAMELERLGESSIPDVVKEFESLGKEPVKAAERLNEKYHFLTVGVYDQIRALEEQGRKEEAAELAQKTLTATLDERTARIKDNLNILQKAFDELTSVAKKAWDTVAGVFRDGSREQQLAQAEADLAKLLEARNGQRALSSSKAREDIDNSNFASEAALRLKIDGLKEEIRLRDQLTKSEVANNQAVAARIAQANEPKGKTGGGTGTPKDPNEDYERLMNRLSGLDANYEKDLNTLYNAFQQGKLGVDEYREAVEALIAKQPFAVKLAQDERRAQEENAKALEFVQRAEERAGKATTDFTVKTQERVEAIQRQIELLGKTPEEAQFINAFADIDRNAAAALERYQEVRALVLSMGKDPSKIDDMIAKLPELAEAAKGQAAEAIKKLQAAQDDLNASWDYGASEALRKYLNEVSNVAKQSENLITGAFKGMEDALTDFVATGKADFSSLAESIIKDLIRMQIQASITGPLAAAMKESGGLGGLLSGLFSSTASGTGAGEAAAGSLWGAVLHGGGVVGSDAGIGSRVVDIETFRRAPRYHAGAIAGDEQPAVLLKGEGVFTEAQMKKLAPAGNVTVNVINNAAGTRATQSQRSDGNGNRIIDVMIEQMDAAMADKINRGDGKTPAALESRYGLNRAAGAY